MATRCRKSRRRYILRYTGARLPFFSMLPRAKIASARARLGAAWPFTRRPLGAAAPRHWAGSARLQHFSADTAELVPVAPEHDRALSPAWTSSGDNHVSLLFRGPEPGRNLIRALIRRLGPQDLKRVGHVIGKSGTYGKSARMLEFSKQFRDAVSGDPVLMAMLEQYLKGSTVHARGGVARVDFSLEQDPHTPRDPPSLAALLLRVRDAAPRFLGAYTEARPHLVLAPRVFGVLSLVDDGDGGDDADGGGDDALPPPRELHPDELAALASRAARDAADAAPLSDEDVGCVAGQRSALSRAADALAARLIAAVPPATLDAFVRSLEDAEAMFTNAAQRHVELRQGAPRKNFERLAMSLGHHWRGVGADLCRFWRVYDSAAVAVCPFQAAAELHSPSYSCFPGR